MALFGVNAGTIDESMSQSSGRRMTLREEEKKAVEERLL